MYRTKAKTCFDSHSDLVLRIIGIAIIISIIIITPIP